MKTFLIALSCAALPAFRYFENDFGGQLTEAEYYCFSIEAETDLIAAAYGLKASDVLPVVYPECARFSTLSNQAEGTVLEYYYIKDGIRGADFSVGRFQMKPSFIEALEMRIASEPWLQSYKAHFSYATQDEKQQREERLDRLLDESWQTHYLCCFYLIQQHDTEGKFTSVDERMAYIAAAYNYGFTRPAAEIAHWRTVNGFPYGQAASEYNYADLALAFNQKMTGHAND
jgi:hypothetical protein